MIYRYPAFDRAMKKLPPQEQEAVVKCARMAESIIGRPHEHSGIGLRSIKGYKEFRIGLHLRCLFILEGGDLHLVFLGTHDEVQSYLRNRC